MSTQRTQKRIFSIGLMLLILTLALLFGAGCESTTQPSADEVAKRQQDSILINALYQSLDRADQQIERLDSITGSIKL